MKKVYRNKKTGQTIYSDKELKLKDFELVMDIRDTQMKKSKVRRK